MMKKEKNNKILNQYATQGVIANLIYTFENKSPRISMIRVFKNSLWLLLPIIILLVVLYIILYNNIFSFIPSILLLLIIILYAYLFFKIFRSTFNEEITIINEYLSKNHLNNIKIMQQIQFYCKSREKKDENLVKYVIAIVSFFATTIGGHILNNILDLELANVSEAIEISMKYIIPILTIIASILLIFTLIFFSIRDYYTYKRLSILLTELIIRKQKRKL